MAKTISIQLFTNYLQTTKTYENIKKIATGKGDDYTTGYLIDYSFFKENYNLITKT